MPNGNYNWNVRCADAANNINTSGNYSLTISYTPTETPASTSGGGGGGGGSIATALTKVTRIIAAVAEGKNLIEFAESEKAAVGVEAIMLDSATAASNVKLMIEKLTAMPAFISASPSGDVYSYLQFNKTILKDEDVKQVKITFNVLKSWVASKGADPEKVKLSRYTTKWEALPTQYLRQNSTYYYYEAFTPGFSVFAIMAEKKAETEKPVKEVNITEKEIEPEIPTQEKEQQGQFKKSFAWLWLIISAILIAIIAIALALKPKKRK